MSKISENLQKIKENSNLTNTKIIAVTKYVDVNEIIEAYESGIRDFAENKVQDAERKRSKLPEIIEKTSKWHFIGHLQTNKIKKVVGNFEYIHSVDSLKLAQHISEEAKNKEIVQKVLIQVNISQEETKFGFGVKEVKEVFLELLNLNSLQIVGLMTMAPYTDNVEIIHTVFREIRNLRNDLVKTYRCSLPELSMGMSNDYQIAIQEGSTMIRLGQILFK